MKFDRRCRIEQKQITLDATYGTEVITWTLYRVLWANIQDALPSRSESVLQGLAVARNQIRVRFERTADTEAIDSSMRCILWRPGEVVFQLVGGPAWVDSPRGIEIVIERYSTGGA